MPVKSEHGDHPPSKNKRRLAALDNVAVDMSVPHKVSRDAYCVQAKVARCGGRNREKTISDELGLKVHMYPMHMVGFVHSNIPVISSDAPRIDENTLLVKRMSIQLSVTPR